MKYHRKFKSTGKIMIVACAATAAAALLSSPGSASTGGAAALLYDYEFTGTTGTVVNSAPNGPVVPLTLDGTWSPVASGVQFSGNTTGDESVAFGQSASGYTLNELGSATVGFGARIKYQRPATGTCFTSTPNLSQIGLYNAQPVPAQAKLQLSDCQTSSTQVMVECRFAGSLTTASEDPPVVSTLPLVSGNLYNISCVKAPDKNGMTTITLNVTAVKTGVTTTNTFTVNAVGYLKTHQYISAGNVYPLPAPADNTNQFTGNMTRTVYCAGTGTQVASCLTTYLPAK
jgi:hypothetical protein